MPPPLEVATVLSSQLTNQQAKLIIQSIAYFNSKPESTSVGSGVNGHASELAIILVAILPHMEREFV